MKLTSKDIMWRGNFKWAVVEKGINTVAVQTEHNPRLNPHEFTTIGAYGYASIFHYTVEREELTPREFDKVDEQLTIQKMVNDINKGK